MRRFNWIDKFLKHHDNELNEGDKWPGQWVELNINRINVQQDRQYLSKLRAIFSPELEEVFLYASNALNNLDDSILTPVLLDIMHDIFIRLTKSVELKPDSIVHKLVMFNAVCATWFSFIAHLYRFIEEARDAMVHFYRNLLKGYGELHQLWKKVLFKHKFVLTNEHDIG